MFPKHKNPTRWEKRQEAIAPYNFVPLPDCVATLPLDALPDHDWFDPARLTGALECELITASPLYVRTGVSPADHARGGKAKDDSRFFHLDDPDSPVIPGSSLRGMLRTMVEIAGYGKLTAASPERLVYRAVGDTTNHGERYRDRLMQHDGHHHYTPLMRAGYMARQGSDWSIRPAKEINGTTFAILRIDEDLFHKLTLVPGCKNAHTIHIESGPYEYQAIRGGFLHIKQSRVIRAAANPAKGLRPAVLAISGRMFSKRNEAVVHEPDPQAALLPLTDDQVEQYRAQVSAEQEKLLDKGGVLREGQPVFYGTEEDGSVFFFGHCRMFRLPYPRSPMEHVPEDLRRPEDIDLAEALFGYVKERDVKEGKARAYAGRVSVGDARLAPGQKDIWLAKGKTLTPKILSGPKPTTFQHYLVQTAPDQVEVGRTKDGKPNYAVFLSDYASATPAETLLRGHKLYWHKGDVRPADFTEAAKPNPVKSKEKEDTQHTQIQPVRAGVTFYFRVNFENLSPAELGALLWVLDVAGDDSYRLKLGMAKPLGLGAVKVTSTLRLTDRQLRYAGLFESDGWQEGWVSGEAQRAELVKAFEKFVLGQIGENVESGLKGQERIRMLLTMLGWPGPDPSRTRYMEIERPDPSAKRGKRNEYDGRPVLPDPLNVGRDMPVRRPEVRHADEEPEPDSQAIRAVSDPRKASRRKIEPLPEPPKSEAEISQSAKDLEALLRQRSADSEKKEAERIKRKEEKKRGRR